MIIAGLDIETTGLKYGDHRIIEVFAGLYACRTRVDSFYRRIHPLRSIEAGAQAVHKISITDLEGCPPWEKIAGELRAFLERADLLVAHNGQDFDLPFINYELGRVGLPVIDKPLIDTMRSGRFATPFGSVPNLGALCFACDVPYDATAAHAAEYDVDKMMDCFFRAVDWNWIKLPEAPASAIAA